MHPSFIEIKLSIIYNSSDYVGSDLVFEKLPLLKTENSGYSFSSQNYVEKKVYACSYF